MPRATGKEKWNEQQFELAKSDLIAKGFSNVKNLYTIHVKPARKGKYWDINKKEWVENKAKVSLSVRIMPRLKKWVQENQEELSKHLK